ncbi:MAG: hypothetical protein HOQ24_00650 [Mycobacteriaceae bacterium]|nr:hypothetical protein [Mycobacteriaceae bacterium]
MRDREPDSSAQYPNTANTAQFQAFVEKGVVEPPAASRLSTTTLALIVAVALLVLIAVVALVLF